MTPFEISLQMKLKSLDRLRHVVFLITFGFGMTWILMEKYKEDMLEV